MAEINSSFQRDRLTWLSYFMLAYFAFLQAAPGPLMPFLRREFAMSYTVAGLHFSAFALGMILGSSSTGWVVRRWGRRVAFWGGGLGMGISAILFTQGTTPAMTILCAFSMGALGTYLLVMIQAILADHHGRHRSVALTESNVIASMGSGIVPALVGGFQGSSLGWRAALLVGVAAWILMGIAYRETAIPAGVRQDDDGDRKVEGLPHLFHLYTMILFLCVAVEWSIIYWGAEFIEKNSAYTAETAAAIMSVFFVAVVISRMVGSLLTRRYTAPLLLVFAGGISTLGFIVFWGTADALMIAGLFVAGLGVANLFPFGLSAAISVIEPYQSDAASARISMTIGLAILTVPQILGSVADKTDIHTAYGLVVIVLILKISTTLAAYRIIGRYNLASD